MIRSTHQATTQEQKKRNHHNCIKDLQKKIRLILFHQKTAIGKNFMKHKIHNSTVLKKLIRRYCFLCQN